VDLHVDVTPRKDLLLTEPEMARENLPLPYTLPTDYPEEFVPLFESYGAVTSSSPLFAVDCEMCLTDRNILELTHVAVVDEKLRCVFNSHVKPEAKIINYLTQYSGVTARDMANPGVLTVKQVQMKLRQLLPRDAILVGHSLSGDLTAMRLIHPYVIDTSVIFNLRGYRGHKSKLRDLAYILLGRKIQEFNQCRKGHGHDPLEDAKATMLLALLKLRNGRGFADFNDVENEGKWPRGLPDFVTWYEGVAIKQKKRRDEEREEKRKSGNEEENEEEMEIEESQEKTLVDGVDANEKPTLVNGASNSNADASLIPAIASSIPTDTAANKTVHIPLRDAFLQRSATKQRLCFRNVFDQLRIQRQRSGVVVDHEEALQAASLMKKETSTTASTDEVSKSASSPETASESATTRSAPTDKLIVREAVKLIPEHFFVCTQLHRCRNFVDAEAEKKRQALTKLDRRLRKIYSSLPSKAMMVVVLSGRKWSEAEVESNRSSLDNAPNNPGSTFHYGLVFGGIKIK